MATIGGEIFGALRAKEKHQTDYLNQALCRGLKLLDTTIADPKTTTA